MRRLLGESKIVTSMPIAELIPLVNRGAFVNFQKVVEYSQQPQSSAEPVELIRGHIVDGRHRLMAALLRGDKTVWVWKRD